MSTIKDVAKLAGVAPSTVSRVVNGGKTSCASKKTIDRIWQAVRETQYSVNVSAQSLRKTDHEEIIYNKVPIDCIFARDINSFVDPFFMELMRIIEKEIYKYRFHIRYQFAISELSAYANSEDSGKSAAIILGRVNENDLKTLQEHYRYLINVGLQDKELNVDSVICPGYSAAVEGIEYLISIGHRKICYLGEVSDEQRYDAFLDVMKKNADLGCEISVVDVSFTPMDSYNKVKEAFQTGLNCTAIFCANDISAVGVLRALREMKLSVPNTISVLGLNDLETVRYLNPLLTTVRIPLEEMGSQAAAMLIDRVNGGHKLPIKTTLPCELVVRKSCSPPPSRPYKHRNNELKQGE